MFMEECQGEPLKGTHGGDWRSYVIELLVPLIGFLQGQQISSWQARKRP